MDTKQVVNTYKLIIQLLSVGHLKHAFDKTLVLANEAQNAAFYDQFNSLQENYRYMLQYYIDGVDDPQRIVIYNKLIAKLFLLNEEIKETLLYQNDTSFEYSKKRYFPYTRKYLTTAELYEALISQHNQSQALMQEAGLHQEEISRLKKNVEEILPELFSIFWLYSKYHDDEKTLFQRIMDKSYPGQIEKALLVSALTLNLWRMFDEEKLMMLFDCCESDSQQVKQRALVGLCFILTKNNKFLSYFPIIRNRLVLMADNEHTFENFRNIIMQIIATTETDKISKKLQEEILPEIVKMSPKLKNKLDAENLLNSDDWEEANPEWQEIIEESGVSDKLKELSNLQLEGADVYMSTFSMLKNFPFFSEFSNWFMPFDPNNSSVHDLFKNDDKSVLTAFVKSRTMCDSDLYSFCLSILQMPAQQRDMMKHSFKMESEQIEEMQKDEELLTPDVVEKNISKQYIQDLFRFFRLYPQKQDFDDMFNFALDIHNTSLFDILSSDNKMPMEIAEYYFSKKLYVQALEIFETLEKRTEPSAALYQKIGYSYQKLSRLHEALNAYLKADMIQPDDIWTIKKIALCYRMTGNFDKAIEFYKHADFLNPDQINTQMQIANCYMAAGKNKEALKILFRLDAIDEDNIKIQRAIAWASFVSADLKQGDYYIQKITESSKVIAHDYLNAGHIAWGLHERKRALEYYRKSWELMQRNWKLFAESFNEDISHLKANGIDEKEIPLMLDELLYTNN